MDDFLYKLKNIWQDIFDSSANSMGDILNDWEQIAWAGGVFILGYLVSIFLKKLILKIGKKIKLPTLAEKSGFKKFLEKAGIKTSASLVIANSIQAWIISVFLLQATEILELNAVAEFLDKIITFIPDVVVSLFIVLLAVRMGDFIGGLVASALTLADSHAAKIVSLTAKSILIIFGVMTALVRLDIKYLNELITVFFVAFVSMLALAGALAFGLGGKDVVREVLEELREKHKQEDQQKTENQEQKQKTKS
jgi:uncharacterized spore protein YtfJ